jgi:DNA-binding transcriptional LysR family regulator
MCAKLVPVADFSITGLRVVQAVADSGSFTAAAELVGYTQSAVSRQVAAMEAAAGTALFSREARGVVPTPAGVVVARRAGMILAELSATSRDLAGLDGGLSGQIVVGAFPTAAAVLVPRTIRRLLQAHPALRIELREGSTPTILRQLRAGRVDVAVVAVGEGLPDYDLGGFAVRPLPGEGVRLAVPADHRLVGRADVVAADLAMEAWIVGDGPKSDPHFAAWPTLSNPVIAYSAPSLSTRLGLVAAGLGIALIPSLATLSVPAGVQVVTVGDPAWPGRQALALANEDHAATTAALLDEVAACAAELLSPPRAATRQP